MRSSRSSLLLAAAFACGLDAEQQAGLSPGVRPGSCGHRAYRPAYSDSKTAITDRISAGSATLDRDFAIAIVLAGNRIAPGRAARGGGPGVRRHSCFSTWT